MTDIRLIFVLPSNATDECEASLAMVQAYESCKQSVDNISWVKESELETKDFSKLDYIVFESFEGKDFSRLIKNKAASVVGPMAVSVCLLEGKPIPNFQWPILNVAMYDCHVTCTNISRRDKEVIKSKVELMGGWCTGGFTDSTTHLICDGTKSEKYMLGAEKGLTLMLPEWIDVIFEESKSRNVSANDPRYLKKYKCPTFHKLTICSTGIINNKEKAQLSEIISSNGGKFVAKLNLAVTDVLICHGVGGTTSDKFKAARKKEVPCVTMQWAYDSVEKGYALPFEKYHVKTCTSTPTKEGENIDPNFSTISCIGITSMRPSTTINETVNLTQISHMAAVAGSVVTPRLSTKRKATDLVEKIDIKKVKNAGQFLDGCSIFVIGFSPEHRDKLNRIVNLSGATRYDGFSERVTHIIVGDPKCHETNLIKASKAYCALVSVDWLIDSVEQQRPVKEDNYLITSKDVEDESEKTNIESPLSKKALRFLKNVNTTVTNNEDNTLVQKLPADVDDPLTRNYLKNATSGKDEEEDTLAMLLRNQDRIAGSEKDSRAEEEFALRTRPFSAKQQSNVAAEEEDQIPFEPHKSSTQVSQVTSDMSGDEYVVSPFFSAHTFFICGFDEELTDTYSQYIVGVGGTIVDKQFKGVADYAVVPLFNPPKRLPAARETVNQLWVLQSIDEECACNIQYYHRPMSMPPSAPLQDCVVTVSVYTGEERDFLKLVIEGLGGTFQEQFSRKNIAAKDVLASTHLVSPTASGKKYEAALRWDIPVVNKDWLLECASTGTKVDVEEFLIGDTKNEDTHDNGQEQSSSTITPQQKTNITSRATTATSNNDTIKTPKQKNYNLPETSSQITPVNTVLQRFNVVGNLSHKPSPKTNETPPVQTPKQQINTPEASSQITPVNTVLQRFNEMHGNVVQEPSPKTYYPWDPKTPDTPLGAFITPNPSPRLRKEMQKYVNSFPDFVPPPKPRRVSTPLSELKKRLYRKVMGIGEYSQSTQDGAGSSTEVQDCEDGNTDAQSKKVRNTSAELNFDGEDVSSEPNAAVQQKLQALQQMVMANSSAGATRRTSKMFESSTNPPGVATHSEVQSQVCTVGWDYGEGEIDSQPPKLFLLSGIEASQRELLANKLRTLGASVSESISYDPSCTHLICLKPGRNEKTLACMAAGKWILHYSYVDKCVKAGEFLGEEEFEFGNPKARHNISYEDKDSCIYYWRKEVKRRGYGAFNDMRAIVVAEKKELITNVIEAGGGVVIHVTPPFSDSIHATHCLLEMKMVKDYSKYVPLAVQGIKCVNTIYINDYLWRNKKEDSDYIIPFFVKYY